MSSISHTVAKPVKLLIVPETGELFTLTPFDVSTAMFLVTAESNLK